MNRVHSNEIYRHSTHCILLHFWLISDVHLQIEFCHILSVNSKGNGFFGAEPQFASNVIIKDGTLGLTSHHCIHGNFNREILIEHIVCRDFETHGIQLNGFEHVTIRNVEIGPSSRKQYFRGEYGQIRALLPRLEKVADENPDASITFANREGGAVTMSDLVEDLIRGTNQIFEYVMTGNEPDISNIKDQKDWFAVRNQFYNPSGLPDGASLYGIYLNMAGENTMTFHMNMNKNAFSDSVMLENVKIHDLRHKMNEYVRVQSRNVENPFGSIYKTAIGSPFEATQMLESVAEDDLLFNPVYKGSMVTDAMFALSEFTENWDYLGKQLIFEEDTLPWLKGINSIHFREFNGF